MSPEESTIKEAIGMLREHAESDTDYEVDVAGRLETYAVPLVRRVNKLNKKLVHRCEKQRLMFDMFVEEVGEEVARKVQRRYLDYLQAHDPEYGQQFKIEYLGLFPPANEEEIND